jgi:hypothetical protein
MTPPAAYASYLRVYEPLTAFGDGERRAWEAYVAANAAPSRERALQLEHDAALRAVTGAVHVGLPDLPDHALVATMDGVVVLCPWRTRVRAAEAFVEFSDDLHDDLADAYLPRVVAEAALEELDDWRLRHRDSRVHILTSAWQVPAAWFLLVEPAERALRLGRAEESGAVPGGSLADARRGQRVGRELIYQTPMTRARQRMARALNVLRTTFGDSSVLDAAEDLGRWLEEFHPRSLVELDYGGLVHLADDDTLTSDDSAADIAASVAALAADDGDAAAEAYGRVLGRMKALQAFESAN